MRIFALIPALAAFVAAVAGAAVEVDAGCVLGIGLGGFETCIALSDQPPGADIKYSGRIEILGEKNKRLGYISKFVNKRGQLTYGPSVADALVVTFTAASTGTTSKIYITATNLNPSYSFVGLIQGYLDTGSNLKSSSWEYLNVGGVRAPGTKPDAPPANIDNSVKDSTGKDRTAETAVWKYDTGTKLLTPQWINSDKSAPKEDLFAGEKDFALYVGGSIGEFENRFPGIPVATVKYKFIPA